MRYRIGVWRRLVGASLGLLMVLALLTGCAELQVEADEEIATESAQISQATSAVAMTQPDITAAASAVAPSVVSLTVYQRSMGGQVASGSGSGIVLSEDGYVLTNNHVISGASSVQVVVDGDDYEATIVGTDSATDLAVVKIDATGLDPAEIGDPAVLEVGQWVIAVGFPYGGDETVTLGIVSGLGRTTVQPTQGDVTAYTNLIQTDASINPGNSGGALADLSGDVVGVNALIESETGENTGIGFAIPIDFSMDVAAQLIDTGSAEHAFLGVGVSSATYATLPAGSDGGALVQTIEEGSPAAEAGIERGDAIVRIGDTDIESASDVFTAVRSSRPGDTIEIELVRDDETVSVTVALAGRMSDQTSSTTDAEPTSEQAYLPPGHP